MPWSSPREGFGWFRRGVAITLATGAVAVQVKLAWAMLPDADWGSLAAVPVLSGMLALTLVWAEWAWHSGKYLVTLLCTVAFMVLFVGSLLNTQGRVSEVRAKHGAGSAHAGSINREAKEAVDRAVEAEREAKENVRQFCGTMTSTTTTTKVKKSTTTNETKSVDVRCDKWAGIYETRQSNTTIARRQFAGAGVSSSEDGVSAQAKSLASVLRLWFNVSEVTVDHTIDFIQPLGLEIGSLVGFLIGFSVGPDAKRSRKKQRDVQAEPKPITHAGADLMVKGLPQGDVTSLVNRWLQETGVPIGESVGQCLKLFNEWANLPSDAVTFVTFGRALDALKIERRTLNGRKLIAGRRPI